MSDTLLRLVRLVASACDARYAFLVAPPPSGGPRLHLWLARDYGVHTDRRTLKLSPHDNPPATPSECLRALRCTWPDQVEMLDLTLAPDDLVLLLRDARGRPLGHLGILGAGPCCLLGSEGLAPLGRLAVAQLELWSGWARPQAW